MTIDQVKSVLNRLTLLQKVGALAAVLVTVFGLKLGYDYADYHWLSQRCSVLKAEYWKRKHEIKERQRLENAGLIQPEVSTRIIRPPTEKPTYEEYKEQEARRQASTDRMFAYFRRLEECGIK